MRVTPPQYVQEVEIEAGRAGRTYIVRRGPDPDAPDGFITEVIRDDVRPGPGLGDIHTRRAIDFIEDDGRPLDELAREWARRMGMGEAA